MSEDELNELEYYRAWNEDLNEKQFKRLKELETKAEEAYLMEGGGPDLSLAGFEAAANAPERERQAIQAQMEGDIAQARREAGTGAPSSFPYLREAYATGTDPEVGALRDLAALPGKGWGALTDIVTGEDPRRAMGMTSEELAAEDRTGRSILASPSLVPSTLAALYTGGMSIPAQIAGQIASNTVFQPGYGEGSAAIDAILTALPAGFSVAASKTKAAGIAAIKRALESKGIKNASPEILEEAYQSLSKAGAGKRVVQESGEALAKDIAGPSLGKADLPKSGILRGLSLDDPQDIPPEAFSSVKKEILESVKSKGGRSLDEANAAIAKVNSFEEAQASINALVSEGGYSTQSYIRDIVEELKKVADVPEMLRASEKYLSVAAKENALNKARRNLSYILKMSGVSAPLDSREGRASIYKIARGKGPISDIYRSLPTIEDLTTEGLLTEPVRNLRAGTALQEIYGDSGRGILDVISEPTVAARGVARSPTGKLVAEKGIRAAGAAAPSVLGGFREPMPYTEDGTQYQEIPTEQQLEFSRGLSEYDNSEKGKKQKADWEKFKNGVPWKNTILRKLYEQGETK